MCQEMIARTPFAGRGLGCKEISIIASVVYHCAKLPASNITQVSIAWQWRHVATHVLASDSLISLFLMIGTPLGLTSLVFLMTQPIFVGSQKWPSDFINMSPPYLSISPWNPPVNPRYPPMSPRHLTMSPWYPFVSPKYRQMCQRYPSVSPIYFPMSPRYPSMSPRLSFIESQISSNEHQCVPIILQ